MSKATCTVEGFVASDPRANNTQSGKRVVSISVPQQRSRKNPQSNEWENVGETTWYQASFWDAEGDEVMRLVAKGTAVILTGQPEVKLYQKSDGSTAANVVLNFPTLGIVPKAARGGSQGGQQAAAEPWGQSAHSGGQAAAGDAWGAPQGGTYNDEVPF